VEADAVVARGDRVAAVRAPVGDELIQLAAGGTTRPEGELQTVDFPETPTDPIAPQLSLIVLLAGLGVAALWEWRRVEAVALGLVEDHLGHCVTQAIEAGGPEADAKVKEASEAIARLVRS